MLNRRLSYANRWDNIIIIIYFNHPSIDYVPGKKIGAPKNPVMGDHWPNAAKPASRSIISNKQPSRALTCAVITLVRAGS